jgi:hypothetical protein
VSIRLNVERGYRAATELAGAGSELRALRTGPGAEIEAAGAAKPWGNDEIGAAFETNYGANATSLLDSWENIAAFVEGIGLQVAEVVKATVEADAVAAHRNRSY